MAPLTPAELSDLKTYLDDLGELHSYPGPMGGVTDDARSRGYKTDSRCSAASASVYRIVKSTITRTDTGEPYVRAEVIAPNMYRNRDANFLVGMPDVMRRLIAEVELARVG